MSDVITQVDKYVRGWTGGLPETPCGAGSTMRETEKQRQWIPEIVKKYGIKSIADIGAGDLNWIKKTDLGDVEYQAYDLVPRDPSVKPFDLIKEVPPKVDLIMCLWVLNHFPYEHCQQAIENLKASGAKYLMMTDRPRYHKDQPPEIHMEPVEKMILNGAKQDSIMLIEL